MSEHVKIEIPITYFRQWNDDYGARGWKLDVTIDDPEIIACTPFHGDKIPTSVLIHDILDHFLCGFGPSGHRNEAMALAQLGSRAGSDIIPDLTQMVEEDLLHGNVIGESLEQFLPNTISQLITDGKAANREIIERLIISMGRDRLKAELIGHMIDIGRQATPMAMGQWNQHGLDYGIRKGIGFALQELFEQTDAYVIQNELQTAQASFWVGNNQCYLSFWSITLSVIVPSSG
ncbi:hypothetical protein JKG47_11660 [Acidithiobacillus sp. MC6.1]|nr:hypothetical protein [Acidithiobacillus sp. MC6.1]